MAALTQNYYNLDENNPTQSMNKAILGLLLNIKEQCSDIQPLKTTVTDLKTRMAAMEAKVGNASEPSIPLSLAIRGLPLPSPGVEDIDLVRQVVRLIRAPSVDPEQDVVKVVRRGAREQNGGTILAEIRSKEAKAAIMKTKKVLEQSENESLRRLIIKNALTDDQMKMNRAMNGVLKLIPGGLNYYIAGNGDVRTKNERQPLSRPAWQPHHRSPRRSPRLSRPPTTELQPSHSQWPSQHEQQYFSQPPPVDNQPPSLLPTLPPVLPSVLPILSTAQNLTQPPLENLTNPAATTDTDAEETMVPSQ